MKQTHYISIDEAHELHKEKTASYLSFMKADQYHFHFLLVLFEPAGWFLLWIGLEH